MSGVIGIIVLLVIAYFVYAFVAVPMLIGRVTKKRLERGVPIAGAFSVPEIAEYLREKLASDKLLQNIQEDQILYEGRPADVIHIIYPWKRSYQFLFVSERDGTYRLCATATTPMQFTPGSGQDFYLGQLEWLENLQTDILQHIDPNYSIADHPEDDSKISKLKWSRRIGVLIEAIIITALIIVTLKLVSWKTSPAGYVSDIILDDFSETETIGKALNTFDSKGKWTSRDSMSDLEKNGIAEVTWTGTCLARTEDQTLRLPITVEFTASTLSENTDQFWVSVDSISVGHSTYSQSGLFEGITLRDLLDVIYGNQEQVSLLVQLTADENSTTFVSICAPGYNGAAPSEPTFFAPVETDPPQAEPTFFIPVETEPPQTDPPFSESSLFDAVVGEWQDEEYDGNYLTISYDDDTRQSAHAFFGMAREFDVELFTDDGETFYGVTTGSGTEPLYRVELCRYKYWLEVSIIVMADGSIEDYKFVPAYQ